MNSTFHSPASSLRITSVWSAAGCPWSLEKCGMRACLTFIKAIFFSKRRSRTAFFLLRDKEPPFECIGKCGYTGQNVGLLQKESATTNLQRLTRQRQLVQSDLIIPTAALAVGIFCLNFKSFAEHKEPNAKFSMSPTMRKTSFRGRSKGSTWKMNSVLLRCRFRKIAASPLNEDFKLNLLYCCSPLKNTDRRKNDL